MSSVSLPTYSAINLHVRRAARVDANPCCQRIVLVWAIRDPGTCAHLYLTMTHLLVDSDQLNWIAEAVTHALSTISSHHSTPAIDIRLHVTTAAEDTQSFEGEERSSVGTDPEAGVGTVVGTDPNPGIARAEKMDPTAKERLLSMPGVNLIYGRPGIKDILDTEIAGARGSVGINGAHIV